MNMNILPAFDFYMAVNKIPNAYGIPRRALPTDILI